MKKTTLDKAVELHGKLARAQRMVELLHEVDDLRDDLAKGVEPESPDNPILALLQGHHCPKCAIMNRLTTILHSMEDSDFSHAVRVVSDEVHNIVTAFGAVTQAEVNSLSDE
jgi:bifunctional pyridoxal-dependent enzyme with beta-cystathionase and maltose regulon repressor activities